jgi:hypothetical protein
MPIDIAEKNPQEKDCRRFSWADQTGSEGLGGLVTLVKKNTLMLKSV